jgi:hypothetical protein
MEEVVTQRPHRIYTVQCYSQVGKVYLIKKDDFERLIESKSLNQTILMEILLKFHLSKERI